MDGCLPVWRSDDAARGGRRPRVRPRDGVGGARAAGTRRGGAPPPTGGDTTPVDARAPTPENVAYEGAGRRNSAVEALTKIGARALPRVYDHLVTEDVDVKLALLHLLGDIPSRENSPYLVYYLNHEDKNLVSAAIASIGKLRDPGNLYAAIPPIKGGVDQPEVDLVQMAREKTTT